MTDLRADFLPNAARAAALDHAMYADLADSVRYLADAAEDALDYDWAGVRAAADRLGSGARFAPGVSAAYYAAVDAVAGGDEPAARAALDEIRAAEPVPERSRIVALQPPGRDREHDRYVRLLCDEGDTPLRVLAPDPDKAAAFADRIGAARRMLAAAAPDLDAELGAIVDEYVLVRGDPSQKLQFDGGSHMQLWGALFLNIDFHPTPVAVAEVLAHESAHSLLFALSREERLIENPDEERYPSPLRVDPRPMFGIYHATFVSARMHWAMRALADWPEISEAERREAEAAMALDARNFAAGEAVVAEHGRLTPLGRRLMDGARAYMAG